jgi:WD40 repeat protein
LFAIASGLGHGQVWDARTWEPQATLRGFLNAPHSVAFSADAKRLVLGGNDREAVKLWDTESWQDVFTLEAPGTGLMGELCFSAGGNTITWGSRTSGLHVWQAPSWEEIAAAEAKERAETQPR